MLSSLVAAALDVGSTSLQFQNGGCTILLALGPPSSSFTQHFNSESEHAAHAAKSAQAEHCAAWKHLCMVAEIHHALLLVQT